VRVIIEELTQRLMSTAYIWHNVSPSGHRCSMNAAMTSGMHNTPEGKQRNKLSMEPLTAGILFIASRLRLTD